MATKKTTRRSKTDEPKQIECSGTTLDDLQEAISGALQADPSDVFHGQPALYLQVKRN
jgi:hypothetical protein